MRAQVRENFGKVVMALVALPRYRHHSIADLQHLVLEPLMHDRIALAYPSADTDDLTDLTGIAIWANVSEEVNEKVREQVRAGVFPVRLRPDEWNSGNINWLFDVIAQDKAATARVLANFRQVVKTGELHLHPMIAGLVDDETLALLRGSASKEAE